MVTPGPIRLYWKGKHREVPAGVSGVICCRHACHNHQQRRRPGSRRSDNARKRRQNRPRATQTVARDNYTPRNNYDDYGGNTRNRAMWTMVASGRVGGVASRGTADAGPSDMERIAMPTGCIQRPRRRPNTNQPNPPRVCRRYGMDLAPGPIPTRARPAVLSQIVARFRVAAVGILIRACATVISLCATVVIVNHYIRKGPDNDRSADSATPPRVKQD